MQMLWFRLPTLNLSGALFFFSFSNDEKNIRTHLKVIFLLLQYDIFKGNGSH